MSPCFLSFVYPSQSQSWSVFKYNMHVAVTSFLQFKYPSYLSSAHLFKSTPTPCSLCLTSIVFWDLFHMQRFDLRRLPGVCGCQWVSVLIHQHDIHHCIYISSCVDDVFWVECYQTLYSSNCSTFYEIYGHHMNMTQPATWVASTAPFSSQHHICCQLFHRFDNIDLHLQNG